MVKSETPAGACARESDMAMVAGKRANKSAQAEAGSVERRAVTGRNPRGRNASRTRGRGVANGASGRIRQYVERNPEEKLAALLCHVTSLRHIEAGRRDSPPRSGGG